MLADGSIRPCTQISNNLVMVDSCHTRCNLHVTDLGDHDMILGQPWLAST